MATRGRAPGQQDSTALGAGFSKAFYPVTLWILLPTHITFGASPSTSALQTGWKQARTLGDCPGHGQRSIPTGPLGIGFLRPLASLAAWLRGRG